MTRAPFPGHSGGPVIDAAGHALAGILVEGSERGRFDRFVPVTLIARVWPRLPRPWLMAGAEPGEARSHFTRRARGQRSAARGGDLFRGRTAALDRIRGWLTADEPPGQPLVMTGQPGAGKSAVLARAALSVEAGHGGPGLAFHARAATIGDFLTALADLTGIDTPASADELVTSLADLPGQSPVPVVLDALDEAASDRDRRQITEALAELAVLPGLRVAVATRTMAAGNPFAPGGLLPALGVTTRDDHNLIDLDSDTYFDLEGLRQFAAALLAQDGMDHPGPPGAAWTQYRARHGVCDRLAAVIAERAGRNFLVAAMAAVPLSTARTMTDPAAKGFDPAGIPSGVGEALSKYLDRLPDQRRERDRELLTALAYARGAGLDDPAWLAFAAALGYGASVADLDALRRSPAADYLLQTTTTERGARPVTRLFHQALTDELLAPRHQPSDESALLDMLLGQAEHTGWQDRYLREHAAEHAAAAGRLDQLLEDPHYLLTVDPARLVPHLDAARSAPARAAAAVYRQSAHHLAPLDRPARASQLELTAHHLGCRSLAARIASAAPDRPWQTRWSHGRRATGHQVLTGHAGAVDAVAAGALPDGTPVIISGGDDGTVRVWRLADGTPVGEPLTRPRRRGVRGGGRGAAGRHPGHHQRRRRRHGAGVAAGRRHPGRGAAARPRRPGERGGGRGAAGRHPGHHQRRRRRHGAGVAAGRRHPGRGAAARPRRRGERGGGRGAAGRHPGHHQRRPRRHGAGVAAGRRHPGRGAAARPRRLGERGGGRGAAGRHPGHHQRRRRRHGAGVAAGRRHPGRGAADRPRRRGVTRWRPGRCRTAPRSSSAAAATARCGCGGWPTAPRSGSR